MDTEVPAGMFGVVIVGYNSAATIAACVGSVCNDSEVREVVVVDNSSDAETERIIREVGSRDPRVRYIAPSENLGFGGGCNLGASLVTECQFLVFLNPDAQIEKPLSGLISPVASVTAGWLVSEDSADAINAREVVSPLREVLKVLRGSQIYSRQVLRRARASQGGWMEVGQLDGAFLVMSRTTFEALAGFDPQFELYYDDVDLCARAADGLDGCALKAERWGVHIGGESYRSSGGLAYRMGKISRARYLRKHFGMSSAVTSLVVAIAVLEVMTRSVTLRAEGWNVRWSSLLEQLRESRDPGSVNLLGSTRQD